MVNPLRNKLRDRPASERELSEPGVRIGPPKKQQEPEIISLRLKLPTDLCEQIDTLRGASTRNVFIVDCLRALLRDGVVNSKKKNG